MSKLLINEHPLVFQPSLAFWFGLHDAIILQQLHYWIKHKSPDGKQFGKVVDGKRWIRNTVEQWRSSNFPFLSASQIYRAMARLEERGVVISRNDLNQAGFDRSKWYSIDYAILHEREMEFASLKIPFIASEDTIPETTKETTKKGAEEKPAPRVPATVEEAIWSGGDIPEDQVGEDAQFNSDVQDAAWLICQGAEDLKPLAIAFMEERHLILPHAEKTGHRKALRVMINSKPNAVTADHVREGIQTMLKARLSIKNLFSVVAAAVEAANPPPIVETEQDDDFDVL